MAHIKRSYPGKSAHEIYQKVDALMEGIADRFSLTYERDHASRTGRVHKYGVTGSYAVSEGEVMVELRFPMLVPGSMRQKVTSDIERHLDELFP